MLLHSLAVPGAPPLGLAWDARGGHIALAIGAASMHGAQNQLRNCGHSTWVQFISEIAQQAHKRQKCIVFVFVSIFFIRPLMTD